MQASRSRAAQERLVELEKESAPFEDQLEEAARFVGVDLNIVGRSSNDKYSGRNGSKTTTLHGKEEWLLRWLLKQLQSSKDDTAK